jgi:hypothetical protein
MVLALAVLLTLVLGVATGGHPSRLARLQVRGWPLLFVAVGVQIYFAGHVTDAQWGPLPLRAGAFVTTHALVLAVTVLNVPLPGMRTAAAGAGSNLLALVANGGLMPVSPQALLTVGHGSTVAALAAGAAVTGSKGILLPPAETGLWPLTDIFLLPPPFPLPAVFSLGDILVALGLGYLIWHTMHTGAADASATNSGPQGALGVSRGLP